MTPAERRVLGRYLLVQAREVHARVNTWCFKHYAVCAGGLPRDPTDDIAVAWCPRGLLWRKAFERGIAPRWGIDEPEPAGVAVAEIWLAQAIEPKLLNPDFMAQVPRPAMVISTWSDGTGDIPLDLIAKYDRALTIADMAINAFELS